MLRFSALATARAHAICNTICWAQRVEEKLCVCRSPSATLGDLRPHKEKLARPESLEKQQRESEGFWECVLPAFPKRHHEAPRLWHNQQLGVRWHLWRIQLLDLPWQRANASHHPVPL
mmetsp:Transcript_57078/g.69729  ORF Transcript_57078/g.69729 Transcript_57078/m.69729 type:complete len:118 (+) Transcript_57078:65-418(+)